MALSRKSFHDSKEWAAAYSPTVRSDGKPLRAGGTTFGLGRDDQSYLLTIDREFLWTVVASGPIEYIVSGKRRGERVIGYLVTDNPVLLRDLNRRWAIDYESIDWTSWENEQPETATVGSESRNGVAPKPKSDRPQPEAAGNPRNNTSPAPLGKVFQRATEAVIKRPKPTVAAVAPRRTEFEEITVSAPPEMVSPPAPVKMKPEAASTPAATSAQAAVTAQPAKPARPARAKKRAKHPQEAPPPALPFPESLESTPPAPETRPVKVAPTFPKPPRPKPRPRPVLPLPPEVPPSMPSGPDPLPTPPPPRPRSMVGEFSNRPAAVLVIPPSAPPRMTARPDPPPTPAPPPRPKRFRIRTLPVGSNAAQLDHDIFGPWPGAVRCPRCGASGFVQDSHSGLAGCEACDGRGWNPPPSSPLELKVWLD